MLNGCAPALVLFLPDRTHACMHAYRSFLCRFVIFLHTCSHVRAYAWVPVCICMLASWLDGWMDGWKVICIPTCLPACLPAYLRACNVCVGLDARLRLRAHARRARIGADI